MEPWDGTQPGAGSSPPASGGPIEAKVVAAGGAGAIIGVVVWLLTTFVFHGALPDAVNNLLNWLVPVIGAVVAGYSARHTPR